MKVFYAVTASNLQYAADTIPFGQAHIEQAQVVQRILGTFELRSGLKVNFHKIHIIFLGDFHINLLIERIIGCPRGDFPIKYLGIRLRQIALKKKIGEIQ